MKHKWAIVKSARELGQIVGMTGDGVHDAPALKQILGLVKEALPELHWLVVRFNTISHVDYSAAKMLLNLLERLKARNVSLVFSDVSSAMQSLLEHYGLIEALGSGRIFPTFIAAVRCYMNQHSELEDSAAWGTSASV